MILDQRFTAVPFQPMNDEQIAIAVMANGITQRV